MLAVPVLDGVSEGVRDTVGEAVGEKLGDALLEELGVADGETLAEGVAVLEVLEVAEGDTLLEGLTVADSEPLADADGDSDAVADRLGLSDAVAVALTLTRGLGLGVESFVFSPPTQTVVIASRMTATVANFLVPRASLEIPQGRTTMYIASNQICIIFIHTATPCNIPRHLFSFSGLLIRRHLA